MKVQKFSSRKTVKQIFGQESVTC